VPISGEQGFGLVEVLIAMVIVLVGVLSAFLAFEASQRADLRAERNAHVAHRAQSEIERIEALPYANVGMESNPTNSGSGNPKDPLNYVVNAPAGYEYDWSHAEKSEGFVSGGTLATSSAWTDGNLSGTLYRFVTWVADPCPACANSKDYKRVTVVLTTPGSAVPFKDSTIVNK
jgi:prepilin-type N-terminal cleavage/methylation domain-containing protein